MSSLAIEKQAFLNRRHFFLTATNDCVKQPNNGYYASSRSSLTSFHKDRCCRMTNLVNKSPATTSALGRKQHKYFLSFPWTKKECRPHQSRPISYTQHAIRSESQLESSFSSLSSSSRTKPYVENGSHTMYNATHEKSSLNSDTTVTLSDLHSLVSHFHTLKDYDSKKSHSHGIKITERLRNQSEHQHRGPGTSTYPSDSCPPKKVQPFLYDPSRTQKPRGNFHRKHNKRAGSAHASKTASSASNVRNSNPNTFVLDLNSEDLKTRRELQKIHPEYKQSQHPNTEIVDSLGDDKKSHLKSISSQFPYSSQTFICNSAYDFFLNVAIPRKKEVKSSMKAQQIYLDKLDSNKVSQELNGAKHENQDFKSKPVSLDNIVMNRTEKNFGKTATENYTPVRSLIRKKKNVLTEESLTFYQELNSKSESPSRNTLSSISATSASNQELQCGLALFSATTTASNLSSNVSFPENCLAKSKKFSRELCSLYEDLIDSGASKFLLQGRNKRNRDINEGNEKASRNLAKYLSCSKKPSGKTLCSDSKPSAQQHKKMFSTVKKESLKKNKLKFQPSKRKTIGNEAVEAKAKSKGQKFSKRKREPLNKRAKYPKQPINENCVPLTSSTCLRSTVPCFHHSACENKPKVQVNLSSKEPCSFERQPDESAAKLIYISETKQKNKSELPDLCHGLITNHELDMAPPETSFSTSFSRSVVLINATFLASRLLIHELIQSPFVKSN